MSRYIDVTDIAKQIADFKRGINSPNSDYMTGYICALSVTEGMIADAPAADVVEVVRCKDCKHYIASYCTRDIKGRTNMFYMTENDYCSYGERIDDGT